MILEEIRLTDFRCFYCKSAIKPSTDADRNVTLVRHQRRIDFGNGGGPAPNFSSVERPEMNMLPKPLADEAQPGNPGMDGFRHRSLHVGMNDGLSATRALVGQPPQAGIARSGRAIAHRAIVNEIDIGAVLVGRPMMLEIVEEAGPSQA